MMVACINFTVGRIPPIILLVTCSLAMLPLAVNPAEKLLSMSQTLADRGRGCVVPAEMFGTRVQLHLDRMPVILDVAEILSR